MKTKRFMRVVEWKDETDWYYIVIGLVTLIGIIFSYIDKEYVLMLFIGMWAGIFILIDALPRGRKVHWEEIKDV